MAQGVRVTKNQFECAKILIKGGAKNKEVAEFLNVSEETVRRIKLSETYEDYLHNSYAMSGTYYRRKREAEEAAARKAEEEARQAEERKKAEEAAKQAKEAAKKAEEEKKPQQVVEHRTSVTVQATHYMETKLDKCIELLTCISAKLAAIIDDLYGTGDPKKGASA